MTILINIPSGFAALVAIAVGFFSFIKLVLQQKKEKKDNKLLFSCALDAISLLVEPILATGTTASHRTEWMNECACNTV